MAGVPRKIYVKEDFLSFFLFYTPPPPPLLVGWGGEVGWSPAEVGAWVGWPPPPVEM